MSATKILISGANTGIGYEIAKKLLRDHQNLHLFIGSRTLANGQKAVADMQPTTHASNQVEVVQLDITSDDSIASCISTITSKTSHLDVLINNAGIAPMAENDSPASLRATYLSAFNTNVAGTAMLTDASIPLLDTSKQVPRLIFITSGLSSLSRVSALANNPSTASTRKTSIDFRPYVVSKCGMNMLAVSYGLQFHELGWKVNLVCPGLRKTGLNNYMERAGDPAEGALEAVSLAMDAEKVVEGAKEKEPGRSGGMWNWDGTAVAW